MRVVGYVVILFFGKQVVNRRYVGFVFRRRFFYQGIYLGQSFARSSFASGVLAVCNYSQPRAYDDARFRRVQTFAYVYAI